MSKVEENTLESLTGETDFYIASFLLVFIKIQSCIIIRISRYFARILTPVQIPLRTEVSNFINNVHSTSGKNEYPIPF